MPIMNDSNIIISVLAWTCVGVFIATSVITILALIKKIKLPSEVYLKRLFLLLIVEIVGIGIFAFKKKVELSPPEFIVITSPTLDLGVDKNWSSFNVQGAYSASQADSKLSGYYKIGDSGKKALRNFKSKNKRIFNVGIPHIPTTKEEIKIYIQLNSEIKDSVSFFIKPL